MNEIIDLCPFCRKPCKVETLGWKNRKYFVRCGNQDDGMFLIGCGYGSPIVDSSEEAIRLHNALCRQGVPVDTLEALEAELTDPNHYTGRDDYAQGWRGANNECADKIHALLERHKQQEG